MRNSSKINQFQENNMSRVAPAERPGVLASTVFAQEAVVQLRESDFTLYDQVPIGLYSTDCVLVLFYVENIESRQLAEIWWLVAQEVAGPTFAACNLLREREVASAFTRLSSLNNPLHWAGMKGVPFILVYQNGLPVAFYNGERAVEPIADYALTLACQTGYREQIQLAGGESIENNYEMPGYTEYTPVRTESIQYKTGAPIRKFDTKGKITLEGTRGAEAEATREEESEAAAGEAPTAAPESPETTETTGASETPTSTVRPSNEALLVPTRGSAAPVEEAAAETPTEEAAGVPAAEEPAEEEIVPTAGSPVAEEAAAEEPAAETTVAPEEEESLVPTAGAAAEEAAGEVPGEAEEAAGEIPEAAAL